MLKQVVYAAVALVALTLGLAPSTVAQEIKPPPVAEVVDSNGVNLISPAATEFPEPSIGIGPKGSGGLYFTHTRRVNALGLTFGASNIQPHFSWVGSNFYGYLSGRNLVGPEVAVFGGSSHIAGGDGSSIATVAGKYVYTAADGTKVTYDPALTNPLPMWGADVLPVLVDEPQILYGWITKLEKPDGEIITWNYVNVPPVTGIYPGFRLQSVTNNLGYQIHFDYRRDDLPDDTAWRDFMEVEKITAIDNAVYACPATAFTCNDSTGANWPYLLYGGPSPTQRTVTDRLGNTTTYSYVTPSPFPQSGVNTFQLTAISSPAAPGTNDISIGLSGAPAASTLSLTINGSTWTYAADTFTGTTTVSGPNGYSRTVVRAGVAGAIPNEVSSVTTNGYTISYSYNALSFLPYEQPGKLTQVTQPDGSYVAYAYDARRNVTQARSVAKSGSGLGDIYTYASYPETGVTVCANAKTCNKPSWVTIAGPASATPSSLPKTDFTYDATHGGVLTETKPAPGSGPFAAIRPQTRYTYNTTGGVVRVATTKSCKTTTTCAGTADETSVETTYNAKRVPSQVVTRAGNNTTAGTPTYSTVITTYTPQGDVESVDGPLSGTVDKVWSFYDVMRRPRVVVAPDPDGAGSLTYRATRSSYDADGNLVTAEQGSVTAPANCNAANSFCPTTMTVLAKATTEYDSYGRKTRTNAINVGTNLPDAVTQYAYDAAGHVECVATRMNSAAFGTLPGACTQSTAGSFGPDRIVRTTYDANGDPLVLQSGYGTALVRNERTFTYLAPGQVSTVKDANNNLTTYEYDGFNRLQNTRYPLKTIGSNASAPTTGVTADFEQLAYDSSGRVSSERRRDGLTVLNTYDNLNRLTFINRPGTELDVTNGYDNYSNLVSASQTGASVMWTYDALGRVLTEVQPNGTVSHVYDTAGRQTQLTYPGASFFINYQYYDDGRIKLIGLNGATTGANVLATYYDDQLGRRGSVCRGTGTSSSCSSVARTAYGYDTLSRLTSLNQDLTTGTAANDVTWTLSYSPASQLVSRVASASTYEWLATATFSDGYAVNGLNQYTAVAGLSLAYDGRGNTTDDTTKTYGYDSSNRLISASNGATLTYDPTGRLLSVVQGTSTTKFLYDGTRLIAEYNGSNTLLRRYIHGDGIDDPIVWYDSSGTTNKRNLFKDERGSVIAADTGTTVTWLRYDEYGNLTPVGTVVPRFQYTGQTWISELSLNYYKARFYTPKLGRFMQTDPIGMKDQINLYAYVGNDPFNRNDPTGEAIVAYRADGTITVTQSFVNNTNGQFTDADIVKTASSFNGTTSTGQKVVFVFVAQNDADAVTITTNPRLNDFDPDPTKRSHTDIIGGRTIELAPNATSNTPRHEIGHGMGAGDQYPTGVDAQGNRVTTAPPGSANTIMGSGNATNPNARSNTQTIDEIVNAPTNTVVVCVMTDVGEICQ